MDQAVPLESRKLKININGIERLIPALHAEWILTREWVSYIPPPGKMNCEV